MPLPRKDIIKYTAAQYKGGLNMLRAERDLLVRALNKVRNRKQAAFLLEVTPPELVIMIYKHSIYSRFGRYRQNFSWNEKNIQDKPKK